MAVWRRIRAGQALAAREALLPTTPPDLVAESKAREASRVDATNAAVRAAGWGDPRIRWVLHTELPEPYGPDPVVFGDVTWLSDY